MRKWFSVVLAAVLPVLPLSVSTSASAAVTSSAFESVAPIRVASAVGRARLSTKSSLSVAVGGVSGIPAGVTAVALNLTAASSSSGELRVWPSGSPVPLVSTMTLTAGGPLTQMVTIQVGLNGRIDFRSTVATDLFVDVLGYYYPATSSASGRFVPSETPSSTTVVTKAGAAAAIDLSAAVPSDVEAVLVSARGSGAVGSWSMGGFPIVSSRLGEVGANHLIVRSPRFEVVSSGGGQLAVDVLGWYTGASGSQSTDGLFVPVSPQRIYDTSSWFNPLGSGVALHAGWTAELSLALPGAGSVLVNAFVSSTHGSGDLVVHPARRERGVAPTLVASRAGQSISGQSVVRLSSSALAVWSAGGAEVVIDMVGWFTGTPLGVTTGPPINAVPVGDSFPGQIWIPDIRMRSIVREDPIWVDFDPTHIPESRSPNQPGLVSIYGHRTSHGREFRNLHRLKKGSRVVLITNGRTYTYSVTSVEVRDPDDPALWSTSSNDQTLALVACHPPTSTKLRIVAFARLTSVT